MPNSKMMPTRVVPRHGTASQLHPGGVRSCKLCEVGLRQGEHHLSRQRKAKAEGRRPKAEGRRSRVPPGPVGRGRGPGQQGQHSEGQAEGNEASALGEEKEKQNSVPLREKRKANRRSEEKR